MLRNLLVVAALLALAPVASALTIEEQGVQAGNPLTDLIKVTVTAADVGQSFTLHYLVPGGTGSLPAGIDLTAEATFTIDQLSASQLGLSVSIRNTSPTSSQTSILSFGFGVSPNATGAFAPDGAGDRFVSVGPGQGGQQQFPGGFKNIDVCIYAANHCSGGDVKKGLAPGATDDVSLRLTGNFSSGRVMLFDFPLKFQGEYGSFEPGGRPPIPEPGAGLLFSAGALLVASRLRRA
jgi:hypothetical protein